MICSGHQVALQTVISPSTYPDSSVNFKGVDDFRVVADLTNEPLLTTQSTVIDVFGGVFN